MQVGNAPTFLIARQLSRQLNMSEDEASTLRFHANPLSGGLHHHR